MENECCICFEDLLTRDEFDKQLKVAAMAGCGHLFHEDCLKNTFAKLKPPPVPVYAQSMEGLYKSHPECPKCRTRPKACQTAKCRPEYGYYGDVAYPCIPYTTIFLEDGVEALFVKNKDEENVKYLEVALPVGTVQKFDLARAARDLGLELEAVTEEAEAMAAQDNFGLPRKFKPKAETVQKELEKMLTRMKGKQADTTIKACVTELKTVSQRLHDDLDLVEHIRDLQEQLDHAEEHKEAYADMIAGDLAAEHQERIAEMEADQEAISQQLLEKTAAHQIVQAEAKDKDKQVKALTASEKKLKGHVAKLEKEKIKHANETKNSKTKLEKAEASVAKEKFNVAQLKEKLKEAEKHAKELEKAMNKAQPKIKPDPKEVIDLSSSLPGTPPRKRARVATRDTSPGTEQSTTTPLSSPPQTPQKSTGLSKQASSDFSKAIMAAGKDESTGSRKDVTINDVAMELLTGWVNSSQASQATPPRATRSGAQKRKAAAL